MLDESIGMPFSSNSVQQNTEYVIFPYYETWQILWLYAKPKDESWLSFQTVHSKI